MNLRYIITNNFAVRFLMKPYQDFKRKKAYSRYQETEDSAYIKTLKDKHTDERCFIIGSGPSLKIEDLEPLKDEYTFGSNRIFKTFDQTSWRPAYYLAVDPNFIRTNWKELDKYHFNEMFLGTDLNFDMSVFKSKATRIFEYTKFKVNKWNDMTAHVSEDVSRYFSVGYTVTFTAIQFAIYMGFSEIYLLGVDFNYSVVRDRKGKIHRIDGVKDYFHGEKFSETVLSYYSSLNAYEKAKEYADSHGIKIFNATRGGKLEVFDRIDIDSVLDGNQERRMG